MLWLTNFYLFSFYPYGLFLQNTFQAVGFVVESLDVKRFVFYLVTKGLWGSSPQPPLLSVRDRQVSIRALSRGCSSHTKTLGHTQSQFQKNTGLIIITFNLYEHGSQQGVTPTFLTNFTFKKMWPSCDILYAPLISVKWSSLLFWFAFLLH